MFFRFSEVIFVLLDGLKKERLLVVDLLHSNKSFTASNTFQKITNPQFHP